MKKTLLKCLALTVTALMLFVSCNAEVSTPVDTDGLAYVTFGNNTRSASFSVNYDIENYENLYWTYTAKKTDKGGTTGKTEGETYLSVDESGKPQKGLNYTIGAFSAGEWEFTLNAYKTLTTETNKSSSTTYSLSNKVYTSEGNKITATLRNGETKSVAADVTYAGETGSIRFGSLGGDDNTTNQNNAYFEWTETGDETEAPCFRIDAYGTTSKKTYVFTNDEKIVEADGDSIGTVYRLVLEKNTSVNDETKYIIKFVKSTNDNNTTSVDTMTSMPADYYSCTVSAYTYNTDKSKTEVANDFTFAFRVYGSATTEIAGNMTEDAQSSFKFNVAKLEVQSFTKASENTTTVKSTNSSATAVFSSDDLDGSASYVFSRNDQGADSSSEKFVVMTKDGTDAGTEQVAVYGSSSFSLEEIKNNESKSISSFTNTVTATIPVAKNLDSENIAVYYYNNGTIDYSKDYFKRYDSGSGLVTIETNHFSTFVVAGKTAAPIYNVTQKRYYSDLQDAIKNLEGTSELKFNSNYTVSENSIEFSKSVTIDLNGNSIKISGKSLTDAFVLKGDNSASYTVTIKNGTIEGSTTNNIFTLNTNAGLTLDNVEMDVECKRGIQIKDTQENANVNVKNSTLRVKKGSDGVYVIATDATVKNNKTSTGIIVDIDYSTLEATSVADDKCGSTALLLNVPGTYTIKNSSIKGERQAAIFRGGTFTVSGSTFEYTTENSTNKGYESKNWSSGNDVPNAAIVIGDRSESAYAYPTTVTFSGTNTLTVPESSNQLYVYQNDATTGTVKVAGIDGSWTVNENINGAEYPLASITKENKTTYYSTLSSAVLAATDKDEVVLLVDAVGSGLMTPDTSNTEKADSRGNITIDLNKHTYTMRDPAVGSKGYETQAMHWGPTASSVTLKNGKFKVSESAENVKMAMQSHTTFTADSVEFDFKSIQVVNYGTAFTGDNAKFNGKEVGVFNNNKGKTMTLTNCTITLNSNSKYGITADDAEKNKTSNEEYGGELILDNTVVNGKVNLCSTKGKLIVKGNNKVTSDQVVSYFDEYTVESKEENWVVTYTLKKTEQ